MTPRWEFRVFGAELGAERAALARAAEAGDEEARTDLYFVVPGRTDASLKLRGGKLDLKLLRAERDGLEQWEPAGQAEFPVAPETLRDRLMGPAGVLLDLPAEPVERDLLIALGRAAPRIRIVQVDKRRQHWSVEGVSAELSRLLVDGSPVESIAVEETDLERAGQAVAALGLAGRRNTSYQRFLVERVFA